MTEVHVLIKLFNTFFLCFIAMPAMAVSPFLAIIFYLLGYQEWWIFICITLYMVIHNSLSIAFNWTISWGAGS